MKFFSFLFCSALILGAQQDAPTDEQQELSSALAEAGNSNNEFLAALEAHLAKYPQAANRFELERALVKTATEIKDNARIIRYGEAVLARDPEDLQTLDAVSRALVASGPPEKLLKYGLAYARALQSLEPKPGSKEKMRWQTRAELDQALGRAFTYQSTALLAQGKPEEAVAAAKQAMEANPAAPAARALGAAYAAQNKHLEACEAYAEVFVVAQDAERTAALADLREEWRKTHDSDKGLGDLVLVAHDRAVERGKQRLARLRSFDPNALKTSAADFIIAGLDGKSLDIASLRGKVVVLDFWATWCGPCRTQQPLYEEVKERFKDRKDVVFLNISTDEDKSLVAPFLEKNQWGKTVYFEDGLSRLLGVNSIPTTIILNKRGEVSSRMNGFVPHRFVDSLSARVQRILEE